MIFFADKAIAIRIHSFDYYTLETNILPCIFFNAALKAQWNVMATGFKPAACLVGRFDLYLKILVVGEFFGPDNILITFRVEVYCTIIGTYRGFFTIT